MIRKVREGWALFTKSKVNGRRRRLGVHKTRAGALAQERAIQARRRGS